MINRIVVWFLVLVFCFTLSVPVFATDMKSGERLIDGADLLTTSDERRLSEQLDEVSQTYDVDVIIVTTMFVGGLSLEAYSEQYGVGDGKDAVVLLISMEGRDSSITASGVGKAAIGNAECDDILDEMNADLRAGDYREAFEIYIQECDHYLDIEINGEPFDWAVSIIVSIVIGLVVALIVTGIMRMQLKSVRAKAGASDYVKAGSMNVSLSRDLFLYRKVDRRPKPKSSSSSGGRSSGNSHGSRKF